MNTPSITEIIARLGHACGLPWARPRERIADPECATCSGRGGWRDGDVPDQWYTCGCLQENPLPPTLAEWAAEWERDHPGEPGPVAEWRSEDGRIRWYVAGPSLTAIRVGRVDARLWSDSEPGWVMVDSDEDERIATADVVELGRLMQAVDGENK